LFNWWALFGSFFIGAVAGIAPAMNAARQKSSGGVERIR